MAESPNDLIVEDGDGVPGANTYASLADIMAMQFILGMDGISFGQFAQLSESNQNTLIIWGTQYIDRRFRFYGQPMFQGQSLQWPRTKNYDDFGFVIPSSTVPNQLKKALGFLTVATAANMKIMVPENTAYPLREKSWGIDGINIDTSDPPSSAIEQDIVIPLFEQRIPELQVMLRSIGELKTLDWVTTDRQSIVNR